MINVAILTPSLTDGDAVSNDVMGMCETLTKYGYRAQIFAENWNVSKTSVKHVDRIKRFLTSSADILVYHYSIGWDTGLNLLKDLKCKKVVKYHNVTPPKFYESIDVSFANICRAGREQLHAVANVSCDLYLSDSSFNASELHGIGVHEANSLVVPPFHHIERLLNIEADLTTLNRYQDTKTNILMVGRLAPNKGHVELIDAFNIYHKEYNRQSRLFIVGKEDTRLETYNQLLRGKVTFLNLQEAVVFTGETSPEALKAYYLLANIFMITSHHEGFCVPLVESMAMKIPIVAYGSSAIPYTVENAGLVWEQLDSYILAGSVDHIVRNESVSYSLGEMGWCRYTETFTNEQIEIKFMEALKKLV